MNSQPLILVIEHDRLIGNLFRTALAEEGYAVQVAGTDREALHHLQGSTPALILLDYDHPSLHDDLVIARLQAQATLQAIPVVVVSSYTRLPTSIEIHAQAIIAKPCNLTRLLGLIACLVPFAT